MFFGQQFETSETQTLTLAQPTTTSARFATLPGLGLFTEYQDSNAGIDGVEFRLGGSNSRSTQIIAPRVIEYGVPFNVTAIARLSGDWEATYLLPNPVHSILNYADQSAFAELTPVPEPSGFLLTLAALSTAAYLHRRSRR